MREWAVHFPVPQEKAVYRTGIIHVCQGHSAHFCVAPRRGQQEWVMRWDNFDGKLNLFPRQIQNISLASHNCFWHNNMKYLLLLLILQTPFPTSRRLLSQDWYLIKLYYLLLITIGSLDSLVWEGPQEVSSPTFCSKQGQTGFRLDFILDS